MIPTLSKKDQRRQDRIYKQTNITQITEIPNGVDIDDLPPLRDSEYDGFDFVANEINLLGRASYDQQKFNYQLNYDQNHTNFEKKQPVYKFKSDEKKDIRKSLKFYSEVTNMDSEYSKIQEKIQLEDDNYPKNFKNIEISQNEGSSLAKPQPVIIVNNQNNFLESKLSCNGSDYNEKVGFDSFNGSQNMEVGFDSAEKEINNSDSKSSLKDTQNSKCIKQDEQEEKALFDSMSEDNAITNSDLLLPGNINTSKTSINKSINQEYYDLNKQIYEDNDDSLSKSPSVKDQMEESQNLEESTIVNTIYQSERVTGLSKKDEPKDFTKKVYFPESRPLPALESKIFEEDDEYEEQTPILALRKLPLSRINVPGKKVSLEQIDSENEEQINKDKAKDANQQENYSSVDSEYQENESLLIESE